MPRAHIQGLCCGPVNRGVAIYNGRVYAGFLDGRVVAVDAETGKLIWSTQDTVPGGDTTLTSAVRVVKGKVIVGSSGAEQAVRGYFSAYDAETGQRVWRFYTVPGDPSKPFEHPELEAAAKTWTGEWWKFGGGGTVWDAMAYDPAADLLYVGTGNGGPWNQNVRSPQGGDNLFLASIIAVKPDTGRMVWYFQENPGETWDFTATQPIILADLNIDGQERKVLMHAPKNGYFYVLDRITGKFISGKPFVKRMTWSMGLDKNGRPIEAPGARYTTEPDPNLARGGRGAQLGADVVQPDHRVGVLFGQRGLGDVRADAASGVQVYAGAQEHGARQGAGPDSGYRVRSDATGSHRQVPGGVGSGEAAGAVAGAVWVRGSGWTNAGDGGRAGILGQRGLQRGDRRESLGRAAAGRASDRLDYVHARREAVCVRDGSQQPEPSAVHVHAGWRRDNASLAASGASAGKGRQRSGAGDPVVT